MTSPRTAAATNLRSRAPGQPDEARMLAAADRIEAGEDDGWLVRHFELAEVEGGE